MRFRLEARRWRSLLWWLAVLAVALPLKHHYSIATAADLEWVLRPLSLFLEWFTGYEFRKDSNHEWFSESADVRLVKSCAGINFMLMSFMAYAWVIRPDGRARTEPYSWLAGRLLLLCAAIIASWATCLLANSLRIIIAMTVNSLVWEPDATGIDAEELHRLIGMVTYMPVLSLQMMLDSRRNPGVVFAAPAVLYALLLVVVPLLTGNALQHPALFLKHLLYVSAMLAAMGGIYLLCRLPAKRRVKRTYTRPFPEIAREVSKPGGFEYR